MARMLFGGEPADVFLHEDEEGDLRAYGPLVARFYDGFDVASSPVLDLLTMDEVAADHIVVADVNETAREGQLPTFWGPDEVYELWVSVNGAPRQLLRPVNLGSTFAPTEAAIDELLSDPSANVFDTGLVHLLDVDGEGVEQAAEGSTLVKLPNGTYGPGNSPVPLSDILWVAASDAPANFTGAPYVCDGVNDEVEINAALSNSFGLKVGLSPGNFDIGEPIRMSYTGDTAAAQASPLSRYLIGAGQSVTKLNVRTGVIAGIYLYDNVGAHVWDLTLNVPEQRGIWAFRSGNPPGQYRSAVNGSVRRVTIAGPPAGTHPNWAMSLKSADKMVIDQVTVTGTKWGIEVVSETADQILSDIVFRDCRVTIVGDGGQCFRTGNDSGDIRGVTFDTCAAVATPVQAGTEGFRISAAGGQTYGVKLINCSAFNLAYAVHTWPNATEVDAQFAVVEPRQSGVFAWAEGSASKFVADEFRLSSNITASTIMIDSAPATYPNEYWYHIFNMGINPIAGTLGNSIVRRGLLEGGGSLASNLVRNRSQLVDRTHIDPVEITATASIGTVSANFTAVETKIRTSLNGKAVFGWFRIRSTNQISPTSNNLTDTPFFTLNSAYRPTETVHALWSTGLATGALTISTTGVMTLITGNQPIAANAIFVLTFIYLKD